MHGVKSRRQHQYSTPLQIPLHFEKSYMAIFETAARKLLHGAAVARGVHAGTFSFGLDGLWQLISGFFAGIFAHLWQLISGVFIGTFVHLWQLISGVFTGFVHLWQLISGVFLGVLADLAGAAHEVALQLEAFWRWLQAAAVVALPYMLGVAAVLLLVALVWYCGPALCVAALGTCKALVVAACYLGHGLYFVGVAVARALSFLLPPCGSCLLQCCTIITMNAPGAAGMLISRAAFEAAPALYFQILRAGGAVVAAAIFCARPVAWALAAPVAALFRVSVGA